MESAVIFILSRSNVGKYRSFHFICRQIKNKCFGDVWLDVDFSSMIYKFGWLRVSDNKIKSPPGRQAPEPRFPPTYPSQSPSKLDRIFLDFEGRDLGDLWPEMDGSGLDQLVLLMEGVVIFILNRSEFGK